MSLHLEFHAALDTGRARSNNEDTVLFDEPLGLAVLADGMGGYQAGEVASDLAAKTFHRAITRWWGALAGGAPEPEQILQALSLGAREANHQVLEAASSRPEWAGMGTTLVVALIQAQQAWVGHIGDSRAYRWRDEQLIQITRDHSLLQEQIDAGLLTPEEAARSVHRNLVTRAVGVEPDVTMDIQAHDLRPGDLLLLCSDGLSDMLPDEAIAQVIREAGDLPSLARALIDAANLAGGRDNISVILVQAKGDAAPAGRSWWPFRR